MAELLPLARQAASDPNTGIDDLVRCADMWPEDVLSNPVLPLLCLSDPATWGHITGKARIVLSLGPWKDAVGALMTWQKRLLAARFAERMVEQSWDDGVPCTRDQARGVVQLARALAAAPGRRKDTRIDKVCKHVRAWSKRPADYHCLPRRISRALWAAVYKTPGQGLNDAARALDESLDAAREGNWTRGAQLAGDRPNWLETANTAEWMNDQADLVYKMRDPEPVDPQAALVAITGLQLLPLTRADVPLLAATGAIEIEARVD